MAGNVCMLQHIPKNGLSCPSFLKGPPAPFSQTHHEHTASAERIPAQDFNRWKEKAVSYLRMGNCLLLFLLGATSSSDEQSKVKSGRSRFPAAGLPGVAASPAPAAALSAPAVPQGSAPSAAPGATPWALLLLLPLGAWALHRPQFLLGHPGPLAVCLQHQLVWPQPAHPAQQPQPLQQPQWHSVHPRHRLMRCQALQHPQPRTLHLLPLPLQAVPRAERPRGRNASWYRLLKRYAMLHW